MKTALSLFTMALVLGSSLALADDWHRISLRSTDGTNILIDYAYDPDNGNTISSSNVWVNVTLPAGADCNVPVRALLMTSERYSSSKSTQTLDLGYAGDSYGRCRFSNTSPARLFIANHGGSARQQIAVVVRGTWLVDPVSGKHDFEYRP